MMMSQWLGWLDALHLNNKSSGYRSAVIISGSSVFCFDTVQAFIKHLKIESVIYLSSSIKDATDTKKAKTLLGKEFDALVFDAHESFDIDAFGAISGTLKSGGLFFLLMPDESVPSYIQKSRFYSRCLSLIGHSESIYHVNKSFAPAALKTKVAAELPNYELPYKNAEQKQAVLSIVETMQIEKRQCIVLSSDRGRGKSSALGLAAALLMKQSVIKIIICAPRKSNTEPVFKQLKRLIKNVEEYDNKLIFQSSSLQYYAPDILLEKKLKPDLLFIDEASAIPIPILEKLLSLTNKIIFSTTIHGYEGTGKGFALKFNKTLDVHFPEWTRIRLSKPIRWLLNDPIEQWVNSMLCLNSELADVKHINKLDNNLIYTSKLKLVNRDLLLNDKNQLSSLFALLVYAHYRTQPSDLVYLLDSKAIRIYSLENSGSIIAVVLINQEGDFSSDLSTQVYQGRRRPQGNLLPQTLTFHAGIEKACCFKYARIMRISVHPELQRSGIGRYLLNEVCKQEQALGMDLIGSSFGATFDLMRFWQSQNFSTVRIGFTRDHVSACHSAVVLKALNNEAVDLLKQLTDKFQAYISIWLQDVLCELTEDIKKPLLADKRCVNDKLMDFEWQDIHSFAHTHRGYEACLPALKKFIEHNSEAIQRLTLQQQHLIQYKIINNNSWTQVAEKLELAGKKPAIKCMRQLISDLLALLE